MKNKINIERPKGFSVTRHRFKPTNNITIDVTPKHAETRRNTPKHAETRRNTPKHAETRRNMFRRRVLLNPSTMVRNFTSLSQNIFVMDGSVHHGSGVPRVHHGSGVPRVHHGSGVPRVHHGSGVPRVHHCVLYTSIVSIAKMFCERLVKFLCVCDGSVHLTRVHHWCTLLCMRTCILYVYAYVYSVCL